MHSLDIFLLSKKMVQTEDKILGLIFNRKKKGGWICPRCKNHTRMRDFKCNNCGNEVLTHDHGFFSSDMRCVKCNVGYSVPACSCGTKISGCWNPYV